MRVEPHESESTRPEPEILHAFDGIADLDCRGRRVFLRVDALLLAFPAGDRAELGSRAPQAAPAAPTVPLAPAGTLTEPDKGQALAAKSSLKELLDREARVVIGTALPHNLRAEFGLTSIDELAARLNQLYGVEVFVPDDCVGDGVRSVLGQLRPGQICLLPDLAADLGESSNDERFARALANNLDAYVGDAFAASHEQHASVVRLPRLVPRRALGVHIRRELTALSRLALAPRGSIGLVLGGPSFAAKVELIESLLPRVKVLATGGGVGLTLLCASGAPPLPGAEMDRLAQARSLLARCRDLGVEVLLPTDFQVRTPEERTSRVVNTRGLGYGARLLDIGPESLARYARALEARRVLCWWDPLGDASALEDSDSSRSLAELCARSNALGITLGSATRQLVRQVPEDMGSAIGLVSIGTRAARLLLAGSRLAGVEALRVRHTGG
ncbi:MAG TPA: phosphoglycerate kinase [Polyangiaceae bacterium]|nr:phosphoglycerate kinase [Polyangiaceae bacterium]